MRVDFDTQAAFDGDEPEPEAPDKPEPEVAELNDVELTLAFMV